MSKIAVILTDNRIDAPMSPHFGKAPWIMIADSEKEAPEFVKNEAQHGRGVASILAAHGCADVILAGIGGGALRHLQAANIGAWAAADHVTGQEALRMFTAGQLTAAIAEESQHGGCCRGQGGHASACCHS